MYSFSPVPCIFPPSLSTTLAEYSRRFLSTLYSVILHLAACILKLFPHILREQCFRLFRFRQVLKHLKYPRAEHGDTRYKFPPFFQYCFIFTAFMSYCCFAKALGVKPASQPGAFLLHFSAVFLLLIQNFKSLPTAFSVFCKPLVVLFRVRSVAPFYPLWDVEKLPVQQTPCCWNGITF